VKYHRAGLKVSNPDSYHRGFPGADFGKDHSPVRTPAVEFLELMGGKLQDCPLAVNNRETIKRLLNSFVDNLSLDKVY